MGNWNHKVGAKVTLSPDHKWDEDNSNPVGIEGEVKYFDDDGVNGLVNVQWSNGDFNSYNVFDSDLIPVEKEA